VHFAKCGNLADRIAALHASRLLIPSMRCWCFTAAVKRAEALSRVEGHLGAVAFSRTGDSATGDFSDAKLIRKFGDVPNDLSAV
jgi:hypothetical protein